MPPQVKAAYEEGVRRGLVKDAYAQGQLSGHKNAVSAFMGTMTEAVPFADEINAGVMSLGGMAQGKKPADAWREARDWQAGQQNAFAADHPVAARVATGAGYAAQMLPMFFTGGASNAFAPAAEQGLKALVKRVGVRTVKNATVGATAAAVNAAAGRGTVQERVQAANEAAPGGAVAGVVLPAVVTGSAKLGAAARAVTAPAARATARAANNAATKFGMGPFLDPREEVVSRLTEALKKDKITGEALNAALTEWQSAGGASPAFMDLIARNGGGQNTMGLIRGAAMSGPGRNVASQYGSQLAADLPDQAAARTMRLTPGEQRPAGAVSEELGQVRGRLAQEQYAQPYDEMVQVPDTVKDMLADSSGRSIIARARADAIENQDWGRQVELDKLLQAGDAGGVGQLPRVSAGTLDRLVIAARERGGAFARRGQNMRARGALARRDQIDATMDRVEGLQPARATYRNLSNQMDAIDLGQQAITQRGDPNVFASDLNRMQANTPQGAQLPDGSQIGLGTAQNAAGVGMRSAMVNAIGEPAAGSTGVLNRFANSPNMRSRLETAFGPEEAGSYQTSVGQLVDQVNNARFINPNSGSQTMGRLSDQELVEAIPQTKTAWVLALIRKVKANATLTDAERELLVKLATTKADPGMIESLPRPPMQNAFMPSTRASVLAIPAGQTQSQNRR